jgi:hypothetical protein
MPAPLRLALSPTARATVRAAFDTTRDAETRLRYQMVLLAADGRTAPQVAPLVQRSAATVQRVLHRFRAGGLAAVLGGEVGAPGAGGGVGRLDEEPAEPRAALAGGPAPGRSVGPLGALPRRGGLRTA